MTINNLTAISPIDGRYRRSVIALENYFSEYALMRYRLKTEIEYFIALTQIPLPQLINFPENKIGALREIYLEFDQKDAEKIKEIESITNHDVKAVEYLIKDKFDLLGLHDFKEFVHFGLTSQDINNTAVPMSYADFLKSTYYPQLEVLLSVLKQMETQWQDVAMLAHTHGQPASPTLLGKEIRVFSERLTSQLKSLQNIPISGKFGGATGNFNAHVAAYPQLSWDVFANNFLSNNLGLQRYSTTTQIEHYDNLAAGFHNIMRINTILIDLCRDFWAYISMDYFKQKIKEGEVGSSAMPHKVNPIDFENAEGNLGMANAVLSFMASKLPVSRLQRDLTDSTVLRNIGVPLAHSIIAMKSAERGLNKLIINELAIKTDLADNWAVVSEAIQNILRREGFDKPYEMLKDLTRGKQSISENDIHQFIDKLPISNMLKTEMKKITPFNYTGIKPQP